MQLAIWTVKLMATQAWTVSTGTSVDMTRGLPITANKEIQMGKYDDMFKQPPREPFEPTPWLIVLLILMGIVLVSLIDNCGVL